MSFYGQGPDREYLESLTRSLGLSNRVTFPGHQSDVHQIWQENHLLVLVSRYEGLGVSMLEAMACGRPVLRTPYGGAAEWIVAEETGYLCPAAEPELIARSLSDALTRNSQWKKMGQAAHRLIRERYNAKPWDVYLAPFDFNPNC
jgi:glycosyltransferase involved in cell wall biosynthesis